MWFLKKLRHPAYRDRSKALKLIKVSPDVFVNDAFKKNRWLLYYQQLS